MVVSFTSRCRRISAHPQQSPYRRPNAFGKIWQRIHPGPGPSTAQSEIEHRSPLLQWKAGKEHIHDSRHISFDGICNDRRITLISCWYSSLKKFPTIPCISSLSSVRLPLESRSRNTLFFFALQEAFLWKKAVFLSPACNQSTRDLCKHDC